MTLSETIRRVEDFLREMELRRLKNKAKNKLRKAEFEKRAEPYRRAIKKADKIINKNKPKENKYFFGSEKKSDKNPLDCSFKLD